MGDLMTNHSEKWQIGDQVLALWQPDNRWYPATIQFIDRGRIFIIFSGDGIEQWTTKGNLIPFNLNVGSRVYCKWKGGTLYYPGTISQKQGKNIYVKYDDGDTEWTTISMICITSDLTESHPYMKIFTLVTIFVGFLLFNDDLLPFNYGNLILGIITIVAGFWALIGTKSYTQLSTAGHLTKTMVYLTVIPGALLAGIFIIFIFMFIGVIQQDKQS